MPIVSKRPDKYRIRELQYVASPLSQNSYSKRYHALKGHQIQWYHQEKDTSQEESK